MIDNYNEVLQETEVLLSDRITLRKFRAEDCRDVLEYGSDELTVKYLVWNAFKSLDDAKAAISNYYLSRPGIYAIELKESSKCIGCISVELEPSHEKASFGYVLNKNYWGKGYMTEALSVILSFCFAELELNRVEATHYVGNDASGKVMEKCRMKQEGVGIKEVKIKGAFQDVVHYGIIKEDWRNQENVAQCINTLGAFCGRRDIPSLTPHEMRKKYGFEQADIMVLFGGSIICGGDVLANAMQNCIAKKYIIVGGAGHTTETLRIKMHQQFPEVTTAGLPEAKVFANYLKYKYNLEPDYLECSSTNCGNNITYLLDLLKEHHIVFQSIILCQDATMQLRMAAGLRKYEPNVTIVNYATYWVDVVVRDDKLTYAQVPWGMWDMERYIALLTGEISRLSDDVDGYGPKGKNYIVHVEVPQDVRNALKLLKEKYGDIVRKANPIYNSN